ncbi:hypothetical protein Vi05172_g9349 [Venturia inaequalis]|nr:hypothetical protein Vi05172_g9349 [Venturia inaequalis]
MKRKTSVLKYSTLAGSGTGGIEALVDGGRPVVPGGKQTRNDVVGRGTAKRDFRS